MLLIINFKNCQTSFLFIVLIIIFFLCFYEPVTAQAIAADGQKPSDVKVMFSDDQSIIIERVLYTALKRSGYNIIAKISGMRTAVADVNFGDAAILPVQTDGWELKYPNLIKVPVAIDNVEFTVYGRANNEYQFTQWSDMAGLRLGFRWQNEYVVNNIARAGAGELVRLNDIDELWDSLISGYTDAVILPRMSHFEYRLPSGVKRSGVIERQPVYSYVNKTYDYLVPLLERAYQEIIDDGTMALIHNGQKLPGDNTVILHINSYNTQNEWERGQMESIRGNLETKTPFEYYSINLNSNEPHSQISFDSIISAMIRAEFVMRYLDLVIASGNEAFEFVLNNYNYLFSNVPVLFFGVQRLDDSVFYGFEENVTGVFEEISFNETVLQMLRFFPDTRRIYILNDHYLSKSICFREAIQKHIELWLLDYHNLPLEFVFNEDKPLQEILNDISGFSTDTLVLIGNYLSDSSQTFYSETDIQKLVCQASMNPVFCLTTSFIGHGTMGGLVSSTGEKSDIVTSMAVDILKGMPVSDVPVIFDSAFLNRWQFDYGVIKKYNINKKNLPADHILINRKLPIWESNASEFRMILTAAFLLFICVLVIFHVRNRRMTANLHLTAMQMKAAAQEASNANKAKSIFLSHMSHEIRTPMNAILGIAEIQLRNEPLSESTQEAFGKIYESGDLLLNIINDILDLSRIESGKLEIVPAKYDIPSLINDTAQLNRLRYENNTVDFIVHVDENTPKDLFGDVLRIKQILNNILSNAFKYTDQGKIEFFVSAETNPEHGTGNSENSLFNNDNVTLVFRVSDTGQGMTENQLSRLFDEYTRFNLETNRSIVGAGLGMSITKYLIDLMNGSITVESEPGKGTTFIVYLPQKRINSEVCGHELTEKLRSFQFKNTAIIKKTQFIREYMPYGNVLVVDDVESNIYVIKGMLMPYGIKIDTASSGFEAIKKIEEGNVYDIVFMDHMMPKMDGIETTKRLRDMGYKHIIIALTANALVGRAEMFMQNGFDSFISKPVDSRELNMLLNEFIRNKKHPEMIEQGSAENVTSLDKELLAAVTYDIENAIAVLEELLPKINTDYADSRLFATTVHGMKSAIANIGEHSLSNIAFKLEQAASNGDTAVLSAETHGFMNSLRSVVEKIKRPESENSGDVSQEDIVFLRNKLDEIKTACEKFILKDAKSVLAELNQKAWPRKISHLINEISLYLIRGELAKIVSAVDKSSGEILNG